jgi:hypothetical protein
MLQQIADALTQSWRDFASGFAMFVPRLIAAIIIVAIGWGLAILARTAVLQVLRWAGFSRFADRTGASEMLRVAQLPRADALVAGIAFWVVLVGFVVAGIDALQLASLGGLVEGFWRFIPRLLLALVIVALGLLVANLVWRATLLASVSAGLPSARLLSAGLRLLVIALSVAIALEQLGLATTIVLTAFAIAFGASMLGLALAFGLGGRELARQLLEQQMRTRETRDTEAAPHL